MSRNLLAAAENAENNLRQLLSGVENLRLMARSIDTNENITQATTVTAQPSTFDREYYSDCDDEDCSGPAL